MRVTFCLLLNLGGEDGVTYPVQRKRMNKYTRPPIVGDIFLIRSADMMAVKQGGESRL